MSNESAGLIALILICAVGFFVLVSPLLLYRWYRKKKGLPPPGTSNKPTFPALQRNATLAGKILLGSFLFIAIAGYLGALDGPSKKDRDWDRNVEAMTAGQQAIRNELKFPSTAKFSEHKYGPLNDHEYYYTAMVRAENSFGQKIPSYWYAVVAFHPGTSQVSHVVEVQQTQ